MVKGRGDEESLALPGGPLWRLAGDLVFFTTAETIVADDTDRGYMDLFERSGGSTELISTGPQNGGEKVPARAPQNAIEDAPGSYAMQRIAK